MKRYLYNYQTVVEFSEPVPIHAVMLRCQPVSNACQTVEQEHLVVSSDYWLQTGYDAFYNRILFGGATEPHKTFAYVSTGIVATDAYKAKYCGENLFLFKQPTTLTTIREPLLTTPENVMDAAHAICEWLSGNIAYQSQCTDVETTAAEVLERKKGVCQDFAHLMIALCRQRGIPVRYVNGFLVGEGETHAWVEVFDGYSWVGFDPTHNRRISDGYVKLAHGRDVHDCPVSRGLYTGQATQKTTIHVTLQEI